MLRATSALLATYRTTGQMARLVDETARDRQCGVWNTKPAETGVRLLARGNRSVLDGAKTFASGAAYVALPLITAATASGEILMVMPQLDGNPTRTGHYRVRGRSETVGARSGPGRRHGPCPCQSDAELQSLADARVS
jgi:hypothetical protein